ncbi:hypothetical protein BDFB_005510 [Asbolus verrucosus]|uniref:Uncharacterized protein n=1 Tax=Asbolus verrucosus TaxID=1661398 RepID=A0A482W174_ASBVE|nr:hypothetical protein BDFB_005510 [Asbolus verrucosus]
MLTTCSRILFKPSVVQGQNLFQWLNIIFNKVDDERRKLVGPDRSCAEWLLRNGAFVKWRYEEEFVTDYKLPSDDVKLHIVEVDATESSIAHHGFAHFVGCKYIEKITFHKCFYLENEALKELSVLKDCLLHIRICECPNITEEGLAHLKALTKLKKIRLSKLYYIKDRNQIINDLQKALPNCNINFFD